MPTLTEGHATDATALPMLRRETQELAEQVSKNLQVQMHLELQSFLEQLQANLKFHADGFGGCGKGPKADELRMSGLITQPAYTEPPFLDSGASGGPPTSDSSEKVQTPCRHSFHESTLLTHHRRGYLAQKEIESVLAREELETDIKKLNKGASHESWRMSAAEPSLLSPDDRVYYHKNRSKSRLSRQKTLGLWTTANMPTGPHRIAKMVVHSLWFDAFLGIAILANAVLIGLQTDWNVKHRGQKAPIMFRICDLVFCSIFIVELCLRLYVYRLKFYSMQGWAWNIFDTFIIIAQLLEESLITLERTTLGNLSFMRILRVFRLIRIIRLVRLLRVIGELRLLVCSVITSLKSLGWTILLIALMMYVNAIWLTQLVADQTDKADDSKIFYYYGSLTDSILSLFQSITSGIDWDDAMRPLVEEISPLWGLIYCFYIAFSVFAMLNVVTGVFVESALQSANQDKEITTVCTMGDFFKKASGGRGKMSWPDFKSHLKNQTMQEYFKLIDMDISEARAIFRLLDLNQTGSISVDEFLSGCVRLRGSAKAIDLVILMQAVQRIETMLKVGRSESLQDLQVAPGRVEHSVDTASVRKDKVTRVFLESSPIRVLPTNGVPLPHAAKSNAEEEQDKVQRPGDEPHWLVEEV